MRVTYHRQYEPRATTASVTYASSYKALGRVQQKGAIFKTTITGRHVNVNGAVYVTNTVKTRQAYKTKITPQAFYRYSTWSTNNKNEKITIQNRTDSNYTNDYTSKRSPLGTSRTYREARRFTTRDGTETGWTVTRHNTIVIKNSPKGEKYTNTVNDYGGKAWVWKTKPFSPVLNLTTTYKTDEQTETFTNGDYVSTRTKTVLLNVTTSTDQKYTIIYRTRHSHTNVIGITTDNFPKDGYITATEAKAEWGEYLTTGHVFGSNDAHAVVENNYILHKLKHAYVGLTINQPTQELVYGKTKYYNEGSNNLGEATRTDTAITRIGGRRINDSSSTYYSLQDLRHREYYGLESTSVGYNAIGSGTGVHRQTVSIYGKKAGDSIQQAVRKVQRVNLVTTIWTRDTCGRGARDFQSGYVAEGIKGGKMTSWYRTAMWSLYTDVRGLKRIRRNTQASSVRQLWYRDNYGWERGYSYNVRILTAKTPELTGREVVVRKKSQVSMLSWRKAVDAGGEHSKCFTSNYITSSTTYGGIYMATRSNSGSGTGWAWKNPAGEFYSKVASRTYTEWGGGERDAEARNTIVTKTSTRTVRDPRSGTYSYENGRTANIAKAEYKDFLIEGGATSPDIQFSYSKLYDSPLDYSHEYYGRGRRFDIDGLKEECLAQQFVTHVTQIEPFGIRTTNSVSSLPIVALGRNTAGHAVAQIVTGKSTYSLRVTYTAVTTEDLTANTVSTEEITRADNSTIKASYAGGQISYPQKPLNDRYTTSISSSTRSTYYKGIVTSSYTVNTLVDTTRIRRFGIPTTAVSSSHLDVHEMYISAQKTDDNSTFVDTNFTDHTQYSLKHFTTTEQESYSTRVPIIDQARDPVEPEEYNDFVFQNYQFATNATYSRVRYTYTYNGSSTLPIYTSGVTGTRMGYGRVWQLNNFTCIGDIDTKGLPVNYEIYNSASIPIYFEMCKNQRHNEGGWNRVTLAPYETYNFAIDLNDYAGALIRRVNRYDGAKWQDFVRKVGTDYNVWYEKIDPPTSHRHKYYSHDIRAIWTGSPPMDTKHLDFKNFWELGMLYGGSVYYPYTSDKETFLWMDSTQYVTYMKDKLKTEYF
jgi:hypothetical protein